MVNANILRTSCVHDPECKNPSISGQYDSEERKEVNGMRTAEDAVRAIGGENFLSKKIYAEPSVYQKQNQKVIAVLYFPFSFVWFYLKYE